MISYAQNFEDVMLARALGDRAAGFYVDIGACFPNVASVTRHFYELGWSGLNVEPMDEPFARLVAERPRDINVKAAVAAHTGEIAVYHGASVGESSAVKPFDTARPLLVPCYTLAELCRRYVTRPIDFLKIDVEGLEHDVVTSGDWKRYRPSIVVVEVTLPWSSQRREDADAIAEFFHGHDYDEAYFDGLNAFFLAREASSLAARFSAPPNVLDRFRMAREAELDASAARLRSHADAVAARLSELETQASASAGEIAALVSRATAAEALVHTLERDGEALRAALHDREGRLEHAQRAWQDAVAAVERLQVALAKATSERNELEERLKASADAARRAEARAQQAEAGAHAAEANARDEAMRAAQAQASAQHAESAARRADAFGKELEARVRDAEAREHRTLVRALQAEDTLASMLTSRSWRITAPLRAVADFLRGAPRGATAPARRASLRAARANALRQARSLARRTPLYDWVAPRVKHRYPRLWLRARALVNDNPPPASAPALAEVASPATGMPVAGGAATNAIPPDASVEELTDRIQREIARRRAS